MSNLQTEQQNESVKLEKLQFKSNLKFDFQRMEFLPLTQKRPRPAPLNLDSLTSTSYKAASLDNISWLKDM